jgi:hypothetical protein
VISVGVRAGVNCPNIPKETSITELDLPFEVCAMTVRSCAPRAPDIIARNAATVIHLKKEFEE